MAGSETRGRCGPAGGLEGWGECSENVLGTYTLGTLGGLAGGSGLR